MYIFVTIYVILNTVQKVTMKTNVYCDVYVNEREKVRMNCGKCCERGFFLFENIGFFVSHSVQQLAL